MANQNLSQFGEKLFVADADHTFIWDTAASISKRVSRNSWLNSGTITSDAPVTISQTWGAVGQTFTAFKVNAAGTSDANSASGSLLADFQLGNASKFKVDKNGYISGVANITAFGANQLFVNNPLAVTGIFSIGSTTITDFIAELSASNKIVCNAGTQFGWGSQALSGGNGVALRASLDTILVRDGAPNTLALRNGAAAQTFNVYGTYTSGTVYERMFMRYNGTALAFQVGAETLGATARPLEFLTAGVKRMALSATGSPVATLFAPSNTVSNILVLRNLSDAAKFQFYLNGSGNSEFYIGASNVLLSEVGNSYFNGGNVGIGTTSPTSKLQVTNGDVEIETVTSGIIMKAAGTANRFRITLNAGGTDFVITAL